MKRNPIVHITSVHLFLWFIAASSIPVFGDTTKVACVGDSITWGWQIEDPNNNGYPALLQKLLGSQYAVENFGVSNLTLCNQGDDPYRNHDIFKASTDFKPDVAVIMLGSNDAKTQNWVYKGAFVSDYIDLIDHYRALGARVYIAPPPPVYGVGRFDITPGVVNDQIVPLVREVAARANVPLIDTFTALSGKPYCFPDSVHPNNEGCSFIAQTVAAAIASDNTSKQRPRVVLLSDFPPLDVIPGGGGEGPPEKLSDPDDIQSMVRFLLYTNDLDVEGLVATSATHANFANKQNILDILGLYDQVDENLRRYDARYPTANQLRSVVSQGQSNSWGKPASEIIGEGKDTEGSDAIIKIVDRPDSRPVWVCVWGGPCDVAQAIWKVQKTRSPDELKHFLSKLRIYMIGFPDKPGQDGTGQWMLDNFPDLFIISSQKTYHGMFAQKSPIGNTDWLNAHIRHGHGPLCDAYPPTGYFPDNPGMQEGDTPTFMYLVSAVRGMNDPEKPNQESWGGQYQQRSPTKNHWFDGPGPISVSKWLPEMQKDFAMRADWMKPFEEEPLKPRMVVLTDISPNHVEPDDTQSIIRLFAYADLFEIECLAHSTGWSVWGDAGDTGLNLIKEAIDLYEKDLPNLMKRSRQKGHEHDDGHQKIGYWPSADYLRKRTMLGSKNRGQKFIGADNNSDGSNAIITLADEDDPRPIWVTVWGGGNTLAQAIWQVQQERSDEELKAFLKKLRVYTITDQDAAQKRGNYVNWPDSSHQWVRKEFDKDLLFIWDESAWLYQNGYGRRRWEDYKTHVQGHGHMGGRYPKYKYGVEGDTPAFLHLLPNGLNNPDMPNQVGWGGYFELGQCKDNATRAYQNHGGKVKEISSKYQRYFYPATFNGFAARMDWVKDGRGNREPLITINGNSDLDVVTLAPKPGMKVILDASKTSDPDGDNLTFKWWILSEAGTYAEEVTLSNSDTSCVTIDVPSDSLGMSFHVICEVTDDGTHNLSSYRRIIFEPK